VNVTACDLENSSISGGSKGRPGGISPPSAGGLAIKCASSVKKAFKWRKHAPFGVIFYLFDKT